MFRELKYGLAFFSCAMIGMCVGMFFFTPAVSRDPISEMDARANAAVIGAIAGSVCWFIYRYAEPVWPKR
jgi:hypothetical protein